MSRQKARSRRRVLLALAIVLPAVAYVLAGFLLLPWAARQAIPSLFEDSLHYRSRVGEISFNPFTLELRAREFALETNEGRHVLGFTEAMADLEWRSLLRGAWVLDELRLVNASLRVEISKDGRLNLAALAPGPRAAPSARPMRLAIGRISVANGSLDFEDYRESYRNRLEQLSIELSSFSTIDQGSGTYELAGSTPGGEQLNSKGHFSLVPIAASGTLALGKAALPRLMPYIDDFGALRIVSGHADLHLPYRFTLEAGGPHFTIKGAKLGIHDLALADATQAARTARFGAIALEGIDFDSAAMLASAKSFRLGETAVALGGDKPLGAIAGPVAIHGAAYDFGKRRSSAAAVDIAGIAIRGAGPDARESSSPGVAPGPPVTSLGPVALQGVEFDAIAMQGAAKSLRLGDSVIALGADKAARATIGPVAIDGAAFDLGKRRASVASFAVAGIALAADDAIRPGLRLRQLALNDLALDMGASSASAAGLRLTGLRLRAERDANGEVDLLRMFVGNGRATDGAGPRKWRASIGMVEIASAAASYTDRTSITPLALTLRSLSAGFSLDAASGDQGVSVRLGTGKVSLARLEASDASEAAGTPRQPAIRLANLALAAARFDSASSALDADSLRIGTLGVNTAIVNGRPSLLDLVPGAKEPGAARTLSARIRVLELGDGSVSLADRASGVAFGLDRLAAKISDLSTDGDGPLAFELSADARSGGQIALRGTAVPRKTTLDANIDARAIALAPLQPLLSRISTTKLASADASLSGKLLIGGDDAKFAYSGSAAIANLALDDPAGRRLIGWASLATESLKATLSPNHIDIDELRLTAPAGRLAIATDGTSNISRAFGESSAAGSDRNAAAAKQESAANVAKGIAVPDTKPEDAKTGGEAPFSVAVRRVRVSEGALDFSDDSLSPGFVAKIYELAGTANNLSSDHETRSQFALEGRVDEFGYARLSGSVNPFAPRNRSSFRVQLRNIDLASASPYAMRFAGYRIATGHLALDLNYRVRASLIEGSNSITFQDLTLGERVESPAALKLPFELAIALLKDADGRITLEVPVSGNLDDPQFSLAPLVWKAVGNLIGSIITAPFRALAHLFGGRSEDDAGTIAFDPGRSRLLPPEREKIGRIAKVLAQRPELKLLIPARYDTEADARAMKRSALGREIGRLAGLAVAENEEPGAVNLEDRQTRSALRSLFIARISQAEFDKLRIEAEEKARASGQPAISVAGRVRSFVSGEPQIADTREFYQTLLRRLRETQLLLPSGMVGLAADRTRAIASALTAAGVDASRIEQTAAEPTADAEARQVTVHLQLDTR